MKKKHEIIRALSATARRRALLPPSPGLEIQYTDMCEWPARIKFWMCSRLLEVDVEDDIVNIQLTGVVELDQYFEGSSFLSRQFPVQFAWKLVT